MAVSPLSVRPVGTCSNGRREMSLKRIYDIFCKAQDTLISIILLAMVGVVFLATVCRYFQLAVLAWPDELTRYLLIWLVFLGCGAASKNDTHFKITFLVEKAPYKLKIGMMAVKIVVTNSLYLILLYFSIGLIQKLSNMNQMSPAMHWPMWFMYMAVPVGCFLMLVQGFITDCRTMAQVVKDERGKEN